MKTPQISSRVGGPRTPRTTEYRKLKNVIEFKDDGLYWTETRGKCKKGTKIKGSPVGNYLAFGCLGKRYYLHRVIYYMIHGEVPFVIDHINGNTRDNSPNNLQNVSYQINNHRRRVLRQNKTSNYRGVHWCKDYNKWKARIVVNHHSYHAGMYDNQALAAMAFDLLAIDKLGENALTNFPYEDYLNE